eukprot:17931-Chlamydomonas_euryale.AAC.2
MKGKDKGGKSEPPLLPARGVLLGEHPAHVERYTTARNSPVPPNGHTSRNSPIAPNRHTWGAAGAGGRGPPVASARYAPGSGCSSDAHASIIMSVHSCSHGSSSHAHTPPAPISASVNDSSCGSSAPPAPAAL